MTIKEWKEKFRELHKEMKEDLGADLLEIHIKDEFIMNWPELSSKNIVSLEVIAK